MWILLIAVLGCETKDPFEDTGYEVEENGSYYDPYTDADGSSSWADSCSFLSGDICLEPNEGDNAVWCAGVGGTYSADACPGGAQGYCALPAGGDFSAAATAYYYGGFDGEAACSAAGGTYTAG